MLQLNNCNIINTLMKSMIQRMRHENFFIDCITRCIKFFQGI